MRPTQEVTPRQTDEYRDRQTDRQARQRQYVT